MVFISATRLKIRYAWHLLPFFLANEAAAKQLCITNGFIEGMELIDKNFTFWTLTMWHMDADMKTFRNSEAHKKAMQKLPFWCNEASYVHWTQEEQQLPDWETVYTKITTDGKITKVRKPSANQLNNTFPEIKWAKTARKFKPLVIK